jgi:hypothetical protein
LRCPSSTWLIKSFQLKNSTAIGFTVTGNRVAFTQQQSETINGRGTPGRALECFVAIFTRVKASTFDLSRAGKVRGQYTIKCFTQEKHHDEHCARVLSVRMCVFDKRSTGPLPPPDPGSFVRPARCSGRVAVASAHIFIQTAPAAQHPSSARCWCEATFEVAALLFDCFRRRIYDDK